MAAREGRDALTLSTQQRKSQGAVTRGVLKGTAVGAPAGVVAVWFLNAYCLPQPMPAEIGAAFGAMVNSALVWLAQWLPEKESKI